MLRSLLVTIVSGLALESAQWAQEAPKIVALSPENLSADIDAKAATKLSVEFDRPMGAGKSICGGGPNFPNIKSTTWLNPKTLEIEVELQPDHDYELGLNCQAFRNFASAEGVVFVPQAWSFATLPSVLPDQVEQKKRNRKAFEALQKQLAESYSYYDLRVKDWDKRFGAAKSDLLLAKTDRVWASLAARLLKPADDIHMYLRLGERTYPVGTRAIDSLYRRKLVEKEFALKPAANDQALFGRNEDGIGYLMIAGWGAPLDLDAVDSALTELRTCKALILDVRPNSGGDEQLARRVAAWFVTGTKTYAKNRFRTGAGKNAFGPVLERQIKGNGNSAQRFGGPIAVLTSRYVMSSNESFVLMLQQADDCTTIGQPTFGSSGNPMPHELGNGVTILMPSWQDLRLDGSCFEGEGLAPELLVEVSDKDLESADLILEKALDLLREKVGG